MNVRVQGVLLRPNRHLASSAKDLLSTFLATFALYYYLKKEKNWKHFRVYSRNLWKDREKVENDLMIFIGSQEGQKG